MRYVGLAAVAVVAVAARPAAAEEPSDRARFTHAAGITAMATGYLVVQLGFARQLAAQNCRWCDPPGLDVRSRYVLKWDDTRRADVISSVTGYGIAPGVLLGLTVYGAGGESSWRRRFDDVVPVVESALVAGLMQHVLKFSVGRQRPYAHYAPGTLMPTKEDNVSFFSGHTALAFSLAVSAGQVATMRGYATAPGIWTLGLSLAATTGYLRIAADRHYLTDVLVGATVGSAVGYLWPRFVTPYLRSDSRVRSTSMVPMSNGIAISGMF